MEKEKLKAIIVKAITEAKDRLEKQIEYILSLDNGSLIMYIESYQKEAVSGNTKRGKLLETAIKIAFRKDTEYVASKALTEM